MKPNRLKNSFKGVPYGKNRLYALFGAEDDAVNWNAARSMLWAILVPALFSFWLNKAYGNVLLGASTKAWFNVWLFLYGMKKDLYHLNQLNDVAGAFIKGVFAWAMYIVVLRKMKRKSLFAQFAVMAAAAGALYVLMWFIISGFRGALLIRFIKHNYAFIFLEAFTTAAFPVFVVVSFGEIKRAGRAVLTAFLSYYVFVACVYTVYKIVHLYSAYKIVDAVDLSSVAFSLSFAVFKALTAYFVIRLLRRDYASFVNPEPISLK